jgi:hypothetical protein
MTAIATKYIGPTNSRGSRIKVTTTDSRPSTGKPDTLTVGWNHALGVEDNHRAAAKALAKKLEWEGAYYQGATEHGFVFVRAREVAFTVGEV